jgi:putative chitobiose transport system permease protein
MSMKSLVPLFVRYAALCLWAVCTVGPFLWLLSTSLKGPSENIFAYPPDLLPQAPTLGNFERVLQSQPFMMYLRNSLLVALMAVSLNLLFSSMAGYALARMEFRGKTIVFGALLASMMVPFQLLMIPVYQLAVTLGLRNSFVGLLLPHACTAFGIFLMKQAFESVPRPLEDAAVMEGVSSFQIWWYVVMPLVRPTLATLAVFSFIAVWGDFLWPLLIVDEPSRFTLPLGVNRLSSTFSLDWRLVAAGAVFSLAPVLLVFGFSQRYFIDGALKGAVKG